MRIRARQEEEWPPDAPDGVVLGRKVGGENVLPVRGSGVIWPLDRLRTHAVIFGDRDSGRIETAMRMAHDVAQKTGAPVFCVDGAGDPELAERFATVMGGLGRRTRVFPDEPFDIWRGSPGLICHWLHRAAGFEDDENDLAGVDQSSLARLMLIIALDGSDGPPRSSGELLERLSYQSMLASERDTFLGVGKDRVERICERVGSLFEKPVWAFDGDWAWDGVDAAYIGLDPSQPSSSGSDLAHFFFEDWALYLRHRKPPDQPSLMLVNGLNEELFSGEDMQVLLGQARLFDSGVISSWDSPADVGPKRQRSILLGALWTVILHRTSQPEDIAGLAGEREVSQVDTDRFIQDGEFRSERVVHRVNKPRLTPEDLARLPDGTAWIIEFGSSIKVEIDPV